MIIAQAPRLSQEEITFLRSLWGRDTAQIPDRWTPDRPEKDQCAVTAALLFRHFGLPLTRGLARLPDGTLESHYWNGDIDLTLQQFPDGTVTDIRPGPQDADAFAYLMTNPDTRRRFEILEARFLARRGAAGAA